MQLQGIPISLLVLILAIFLMIENQNIIVLGDLLRQENNSTESPTFIDRIDLEVSQSMSYEYAEYDVVPTPAKVTRPPHESIPKTKKPTTSTIAFKKHPTAEPTGMLGIRSQTKKPTHKPTKKPTKSKKGDIPTKKPTLRPTKKPTKHFVLSHFDKASEKFVLSLTSQDSKQLRALSGQATENPGLRTKLGLEQRHFQAQQAVASPTDRTDGTGPAGHVICFASITDRWLAYVIQQIRGDDEQELLVLQEIEMEWSTLDGMGRVMAVQEELGGENGAAADLVTPFRRLVRADDVQVREAPFTASRRTDCRLYLFKDLLILARPSAGVVATTITNAMMVASQPAASAELFASLVTGGAQKIISKKVSGSSLRASDLGNISNSNTIASVESVGSVGSNGGGYGYGYGIGNGNGNSNNNNNGSAALTQGSAVISGGRGKFKVAHYLDLHKVHVKLAPPKKEGEGSTEIELTCVSRITQEAKGNIPAKVITTIDKIELSACNALLCEEIFCAIQEQIDELEELDNQRRESSLNSLSLASNGASVTEEPKKREWAKKRSTLKHVHSAKSMGDGMTEGGESLSGLSLADLEARYHMDMKIPAQTDVRAEFEVQFGEGPMGFALSSGSGIGVIIGRLAHGGFAEMGGVCIGDRIMAIGEKEIGLDEAWQNVVEDLKTIPRPVMVKFERSASRQAEHDESKRTEGDPAATGLHKQRSWASRRAHAASAGAALLTLHELEKMYKTVAPNTEGLDETINFVFDEAKKDAGENEAKCCHVLKEIFTTEKLYVADLRTLVGEYIIPLRRTLRRSKCKDVEGGSTICEHSLIRSTCSRTSSEAHPILAPDDVKSIFLNVETLVSVNSELLRVLEKEILELGKKCKEEGTKPTLGLIVAIYAPAFLKVMPFFKMYSAYCHKYASASERLADVRSENKGLDEFLLAKEQKSLKTSLKSLLIKPIQRICKYPLLFAELLRSFPQTPDLEMYFKELTEAAHTVDEIATSVNKNVGDREAVEKIMEAYDELGGEAGAPGLITAHRRFLHHNNVLLTVVGEKETKKEHTMYLFNDLIIFAKGVHSGFSVLARRSFGLTSKLSFGRKSVGTALNSSTSGKAGGDKPILKIAVRLEIVDCDIKILPDPDSEGCYAFSIKYIERSSTQDTKTGTLKVLTDVKKYEVWLPTQEERNDIFNEIAELIKHQEDLVEGQKKVEVEHGSSSLKPKRSWREKGVFPSMDQIASKYSMGGKAAVSD